MTELSMGNHNSFSFLSLWQPVPNFQIEGGRAVKGLNLQFGNPECKFRSDRLLDLFTVIPSSNPGPRL